MKSVRRRAGALFLCLALCFLTACSSSSSIIFYDIPAGVTTLDPQRATDETARMIISNSFEGLLRQMPDGTLVPAAAQRYEVSDDQLTYTFFLNSGLTWSNGSPLTAHDFEFALRRLFDPISLSPFAPSFISIRGAQDIISGHDSHDTLGIKATNDHTLVLTLARPDSLLPELLASSFSMPCNEQFFRSTRARYGLSLDTLIFNGPFNVSYWDNESLIRLRPNASFHDSGALQIDGVNLYINQEGASERFLDGKTDACKMDYSAMAAVTERGGSTQRFEDIVWVLAVNLDTIDNPNMRRAIAHSVDRSLFSGLLPENLRPTSTLIPPALQVSGHSYREYAGDESPIASDMQLAQQQLDIGLSALDATRIELSEILVCDDEVQPLIAGMLQRNFERHLSLSTGLVRLPKDELISRVQSGDYQAAIFPISAPYSSPDSILNMFRSDNAENFSGYKNEAFDSLLDSMMSATTQTRLDIYKRAEQMLLSDCAIVPLFLETSYYASAKGVEGIGFSPYLSGIVFRDAQKDTN